MSELEPRKAAGFVLFRKSAGGPHYLLLQNSLHLTWGFPKGHLEEGEDEQAGALRELEEETGLTSVRIVGGFGETCRYPVSYPEGEREKVVHYALAECLDGEVSISDEHCEARWVTLGEALDLLGYEDLRRVIQAAHDVVEA